MDAASAKSVLLIDDDEELCDLLRKFLGHEGFEIEVTTDGAAGLERAVSGEHSVVVLDVMLPMLNGFDVLREIRRRSHVPVIMLTARGEDVDRIVGLELGADDYQAKPFNPRELAARIRAIQRRTLLPHLASSASAVPPPSSPSSGSPPSSERRLLPDEARVLRVGDVVLHSQLRSVRRAEHEVPLTSVEFSILEQLLKSAGSIVSRESLARDGLGRRLSQSDRSVDVHVSNLRKKLGPAQDGRERIKSIRGVGYQYALG
ncbi:MAG TPA: response regulator transcription factor [Polyangiaceae bacterium]|nr:response regulator transcription factor [Polyangiaceae bacterium]